MKGSRSFRDPAGYVSVSQDVVLRTVLPAGSENLRAYLESPTAERLIRSGSLVSARPVESPSPTASSVWEHERIPFPAYPHEWPAEMLFAATELTLDLCEGLLAEGRGLKDATPHNVVFRGPRPVFVDVLSFEQREPLETLWLAESQFIRTFLIPLLLEKRAGVPLAELFTAHRDGLSPLEASARLRGTSRWVPPAPGLVTLPARAARLESDRLYQPRRAREPDEARYILGSLFRRLRRTLAKLRPEPRESDWTSYQPQCPSYSPQQAEEKRAFITGALRVAGAQRVLDVGANTGEFSLLAARRGALVVAIERDARCAGRIFTTARAENADILPLVMDFARPTPAIGWLCGEQQSFFDRAHRFFDCTFMLAVLHHLLVRDQVPLNEIFDAAALVTNRWLVIEYVGPSDPMFHRLARGRDALYTWLTPAAFEESARRRFEVVEKGPVTGAGRILYFLRRRD
jgi:SAM-dependent methyltransferase